MSRGFDYLVFDTSPGLQYSSINAIVTADLVVVATTGDRSDVDGTRRMLDELYNLFEKKTGLVLNKVLDSLRNPRRMKWAVKFKTTYQGAAARVCAMFLRNSASGRRLHFRSGQARSSFHENSG